MLVKAKTYSTSNTALNLFSRKLLYWPHTQAQPLLLYIWKLKAFGLSTWFLSSGRQINGWIHFEWDENLISDFQGFS